MSVFSVNRLFTGRSAGDTLAHRRTYREEWEVVTTDLAADDEQVVANALGIPQRGSAHPVDSQAIVTEVEIAQGDDNPYIWRVSVQYDTQPDFPQAIDGATGDPNDPATFAENPLDRPATWRYFFIRTQVPVKEWYRRDADTGILDADLTSIRNSAKLPFDPPLMDYITTPAIRLTKNVAGLDAAYLLQLQNAINDDEWQGFAKWTAKIDNVEASSKLENGLAFVELTVEILIEPETWLPRILDAGFQERLSRTDPVSGDPVETWNVIVDVRGNTMGPYPLNGNGKLLPPDDDPVYLQGLPAHLHEEDFTAILGL